MIIGGACVSAETLHAGYFHVRVGVFTMYYQICPRCQFRSPSSKTVCATCGKSLPKQQSTEQVVNKGSNTASRVASPAQKPSFWKSFLGINDASDVSSEKSHDEPALGDA